MTRMSLPTPTLQTDRLRLRPFADADADDLYALHGSAYVLRYWDSPPWTGPERAERFLTGCRELAEEGSGARLAIELASDSAFLGWCSLSRWNPDYRSASLGYCLSDAAWGHGYATEGARAVLQWAFKALDLNRVQAECDTRNEASARVLEKLGFVREGTLREDCIVSGVVSDSWVYGLLRREQLDTAQSWSSAKRCWALAVRPVDPVDGVGQSGAGMWSSTGAGDQVTPTCQVLGHGAVGRQVLHSDDQSPAGSDHMVQQVTEVRRPGSGRDVVEPGPHEVVAPGRDPTVGVGDVDAIGPLRNSPGPGRRAWR